MTVENKDQMTDEDQLRQYGEALDKRQKASLELTDDQGGGDGLPKIDVVIFSELTERWFNTDAAKLFPPGDDSL